MATAPTTPSPSLSIEAIVAVDVAARVPAPPARPGGRLHGRGRRRAPAVHGLVARRVSDAADRLGQAGVRPAVVTRRPAARVRARRGDLGRRGRRVAPDPGRRPTGARSRAALVARRPPARLPVAPSRLDPGLADRRAGAPPGSAGERAASAAADRPDRSRDRRRRLRLGARRRPDRGHEPAPGGPRDLPDLARRRRDRCVEGRRRRAQPRRRRRVDGRWLAPVRVGRGRLVPGRPADRRRARSDRPDRRGARARRARRRHRSRSAAVAGRQPVRPHRGPRRPAGPARRRARRGAAAQAGQGSPAEGAPHGQRDGHWQPDQSVGRRVAGRRLARGRSLDRRDRRARFRAAGPVAAARPGRRARWLAAAAGDRFDAGRAPGGAGSRPRRPWPNGSSSRRATGSSSRARSGGRPARPASAGHAASRRSSGRMAARPASSSARSSRSSTSSSPRASRSSTSTSAARPATAGPSATPTTASGATATSTTSSTPVAGPRRSPGPTGGWPSTAARTAATWSCRRSSTSPRCGGRASTCSATPRSPRATGTAIGSAGRDLHRMMGSPDDPSRAEIYRRGSPVYRAERIEAPVLILHGRKDKRVVPLMTEKMVEALEIEGKSYEVHWYDEEAPRLGAPREPTRRLRAHAGVPPDARPRRAGRLVERIRSRRGAGTANPRRPRARPASPARS